MLTKHQRWTVQGVSRGRASDRHARRDQGTIQGRESSLSLSLSLSSVGATSLTQWVVISQIVNEIQDQPEYSEAINTLSGLARKYFELAKEEVVDAAKATTANVKVEDVETNQEADNAVALLRQIVESFTGDLSPALEAASALYKHLENDERFQKIWSEFEELVDRAINDPGYVTSEKASRRFEKIYNEARSIVEANAEYVHSPSSSETALLESVH